MAPILNVTQTGFVAKAVHGVVHGGDGLRFKLRRMSVQVNIMPNGRMSLPAVIRKRLGLEGGGAILIEETADGIVLRTVAQAVARAQAIAKKYADQPNASVDAFLVARREDSGE